MLYFWLVLLILINAFWLVLVFFALPGNWLVVASTCLFAWWRWEDGVFSIYTLAAIAVLAALGEVIEFLSGMGGAKRAGAGRRGMVGAFAGAIAGAVIGTFVIPIPFVGTLIGACVGAAIGTWGLEFTGGREMRHSIRSGLGAGAGVFIGTTAKFMTGVLIWFIVAVAAFWP